MTFTYDLRNNVGKLRIELADIDENDYVFEDDELEYFIAKAKDNILWAKVFACESRCMIDANMNGMEIEVGDTRIKGGTSLGVNWCVIAKDLRDLLSSGLAFENKVDPYAYVSGVYSQDRKQNEQEIRDGLILERDFYDDYNESHYEDQ